MRQLTLVAVTLLLGFASLTPIARADDESELQDRIDELQSQLDDLKAEQSDKSDDSRDCTGWARERHGHKHRARLK